MTWTQSSARHMVKLKDLNYVKRVIRHNKKKADAIYYYSVPPGMPRAKIPYPIGSEENCAARFVNYVLTRNELSPKKKRDNQLGKQPPEPGSMSHLVAIYRGDRDLDIMPHIFWARLKEKTRKDYTRYLDIINERFGPFQVRDFTPEAIAKFRDSLAQVDDTGLPKKPYAGNNALAVMKALFKVAILKTSIFNMTVNPARDVGKFGKKDGVRARRQFWTYEQQETFCQVADKLDPQIGTAIRLLAYFGQRPGDTLAMKDTAYDGEKVDVVQEKTDERVRIPPHQDIKPLLDRIRQQARDRGRIGGPMIDFGFKGADLYSHFSKRWDLVKAEAVKLDPDLADLRRQDLRRTAVIRLSEAGCEVPQISAITGHTLASVTHILETYFVRTEVMAESAITKLQDWQQAQKKKEGLICQGKNLKLET